MTAHNGNPFRRFWDLGYRRLLPVVPHDCGLRAAGKRPGVKGDNGWYGTSVKQYDATLDDLDRWAAMGAGVGFRCDSVGLLFGLDIDTSSPVWSEKIMRAAFKLLGPSKRRIGAKVLLPYRLSAPLEYQQARFDDGVDEKRPGLIEGLAGADDTKWFVAHGIHPGTGRPYSWPDGVPAFNDLTIVTPDQVRDFFTRLREELPRHASSGSAATDRTSVNQDHLKAVDLDMLRRAMEALPNDPERIGYKEWSETAVALRGACQDDINFGLDLFCEWSEKADLTDETEDAARVYHSFQPPFALGAKFVFDQAREIAGFDQHIAASWYDDSPPQPPYEPLFGETEEAKAESSALYEVLTVDAIFSRPDPKFLIDRHVPEASVGFLYGDPGTGKSFIALDWALHLAYDREAWHGDPLRAVPGAAVIYLAGEGASGFKTRVAAWMARHGIPAGQRGRFGLIHQSVNFMAPADVQRLVRTLREAVRIPVAAVIVDTVSRSMPGADENLQKEMTLFVKACDLIRDSFGCAVIGVHHAGKSGDMRGSTVLRGAGDFVFKLERKKGHGVGHLICEKMKDAPDGWNDAYRFDVVTVGADKSSLVPMRCETAIGTETALTPDVTAAVLSAMRAAWESGEPWGKTYHAGERMAARRMTRDFGFEMSSAEQVLNVWLGSGMVVEDILSAKSKRKGLRVVSDAVEKDAASEENGGKNAFE